MGENTKSLLFLCKCGTNIANFVDLEAIEMWAKESNGVEVVEVQNLLCAPAGKAFYKEMLEAKRPDNIIVAACSPKMHEKTFRELAEEIGINLSRVQMANIREQCAWVTKDKAEATEKAKVLINASIKRARLSEDLQKQTMKVLTDVLIIGGGIAGIEAALTASAAGRKVYIVEREVSLGGEVIKTEEVAPPMECAPCLLAPRLSAIKDDPNITVIANAEVTEVVGFYGNFTAKIHKKACYVENSCIGCEACFEVCPVSVKSDFHLGMGERKAVYTQFPGSVPATAVVDKRHCKHFTDGSCEACVPVCPFNSINFDQQDEDISVNIGAIIIATGYENGDVSKFDNLGHGKIDNVFTTPEFERIASSNGPFGGTIQLRNGEKPKSIAVVHCAGSMRDDGIKYCSGICCSVATKVGELVRKQIPDARVYNIHHDLVFGSPAEHEFYNHQSKEGSEYVYCSDLKGVKVSGADSKLRVEGPGFEPVEVDMVVLSTGLKPAKGTEQLAEMLNVDLKKDGFYKPDHELLHATGASLDGIYVAGCASAPCNLSTAVTTAQASVGDVLSKLVPGREIDLEIMTSVIDSEKCGGCKLCLVVCPYKAVIYDAVEKVSKVNEAICRGCGTCVAACPSGAAKAKHFTDEQIYAEIGGIVNV